MDAKSLLQTTRPGNDNDQIIPYYVLRVLIGAAGIFLPLLLVIGKLIFNRSMELEYSISDYYDNGTAGDIFVGILFALAFFLVSYKGYAPIDSIAANLGSLFALGVALCPTTSDHKTVHILHFVFAVLLFSVFIFFSIYLFRKSKPGTKKITKKKEERNHIYLACGIIMIVCIVFIALVSLTNFLRQETIKYSLVFWAETIALVSFGFSWITKAEVLFLKDADSPVEKLDE
jgi:hypothetical protein